MITIRQMRYFDALAHTAHFGRAAAMANVSQPALSAQIVEMERLLDTKLVERGRGATMLTADGEALLPEIRTILELVDRLHHHAKRQRGVLEGQVRLGIIPTVAPYLVPVLIPALRADFPDLEIELKELLTDGCVGELKKGRLDCAIIALPLEDPAIASRLLFEDRFMIASADNEKVVLVSPMTEDKMDVDRLLLLEEGHCLRDQALAVCGTSAGRRVANYGATSMATLLQMVSHGMGITLIPEIAVRDERSRNRMRIVPFADPQPSRRIGLIWRKSDTGTARDRAVLGDFVVTAAEKLLLPEFG